MTRTATDAALASLETEISIERSENDEAIAKLEAEIEALKAQSNPSNSTFPKVLYGVNPSGYMKAGETQVNAWNRIMAAYGNINIVRWWANTFFTSWTSVPSRFGTRPLYINLGSDVPGALTGMYDQPFLKIVTTAPTDRLIVYSFAHEPEDDVFTKKLFSVSDWQSAQMRFGKIHAGARTPNQLFVPLLMGSTYQDSRYAASAKGNIAWNEWFNFDLRSIDGLGGDMYQWGKDDATADTAEKLIGPFINACKTLKKLGMIGELGARRVNPPSSPGISDAARAAFLKDVQTLCDANAAIIKGICYFESDNGAADKVPWALTPAPGTNQYASPKALAAWKAISAS